MLVDRAAVVPVAHQGMLLRASGVMQALGLDQTLLVAVALALSRAYFESPSSTCLLDFLVPSLCT